MAYHENLYLLVFLPLILIVYQVFPKKLRPYVLLVFSCLFFLANSKWIIVPILLTVLIWLAGMRIEKIRLDAEQKLPELDKAGKKELKAETEKRTHRIMIIGNLIILGILFYAQYLHFTVDNVNRVFSVFGIDLALKVGKTFFPIGISFYSLEAIGYLIDVYWNKVQADHNPFRLGLFILFFPQVMEGPIASYKDTAAQLWSGEGLKVDNISAGLFRILLGLFKKMMVADRLARVVGCVYNNYTDMYGFMVILGAVSYTIQLYMEFSGSIDIVIGSAEMLGIKLPENFRQPFMAQNAADFWRRWHISLGTWFRTYLFYAVSMSKSVKAINKKLRKSRGKYAAMVGTSAMALLPVWLATGLWHGPSWTYIFYGFYYFCILLAETAIQPYMEKLEDRLQITAKTPWYAALNIVRTWIVIFTGELFFRAKTMRQALVLFKHIFTGSFFPERGVWTILTDQKAILLEKADYLAILGGIIVIVIIDICREKDLKLREKILQGPIALRWSVYYLLIIALLVFGAYGSGFQAVELIYAGF